MIVVSLLPGARTCGVPGRGSPAGVLDPSALSAKREPFSTLHLLSVLRTLRRTGRPRSQPIYRLRTTTLIPSFGRSDIAGKILTG